MPLVSAALCWSTLSDLGIDPGEVVNGCSFIFLVDQYTETLKWTKLYYAHL